MLTLKQRVKKGIRLLKKHDKKWWKKIKLKKLDLGDPDYCVVGQLFGDYYVGLRNLGSPNAFQNGFQSFFKIEKLQKLWKRAIRKRKEK